MPLHVMMVSKDDVSVRFFMSVGINGGMVEPEAGRIKDLGRVRLKNRGAGQGFSPFQRLKLEAI